jgi:hypothetical protein
VGRFHGVRSNDDADRPQAGGYSNCESRHDRNRTDDRKRAPKAFASSAVRAFLHGRERIGIESDVQAVFVPQARRYGVPGELWGFKGGLAFFTRCGSIRQRHETTAPDDYRLSFDLYSL